MAPGYRNQNRRQNRTGYVDHDVFEGLPVRHWRRDYVTVAPPPTQESTSAQNDIWAVELPYGMPKDSHLLPQHSQDLLRAARSGRIYKRPTPVEEEEVDPEATLGDKPEKKDDDAKDKGFTTRAWKQIPRHLEGPDVEYLAKRRKGLITIVSKANTSSGPTLTKTTVRRTDAAGNEYVQDIIAPRGQQVEGEVISQFIISDPKGGETLHVHPTPSKRKGPPSRKKLKGPGRGRKKKLVAPTSVPQSTQFGGISLSGEGTGGAVDADGVKIDGENGTISAANEDTEMAEGSIGASDDDDGEDGDDGEEGDEDEGLLDIPNSPSIPPRGFSPIPSDLPTMRQTPSLYPTDNDMDGMDLPGPPLPHIRRAEGKSGSPLKQIALTTSSLASPLESPITTQDPFTDISPGQEVSNVLETIEPPFLNDSITQETNATTVELAAAEDENNTAGEVKQEQEEEMLLDTVENRNNENIGLEKTPPMQNPETTVAESVPAEVVEPQPEETDVASPVGPHISEGEASQPVEQNDDDFPDLLAGLDQQLKEPEAPDSVPTPPAEPLPEVIEKQDLPEKSTEQELELEPKP